MTWGNFEVADMSAASVEMSSFDGCMMAGANLMEAGFSEVNARGVTFDYADMSISEFEVCDLSFSTFRRADLTDTLFGDTTLTCTEWTQARRRTRLE